MKKKRFELNDGLRYETLLLALAAVVVIVIYAGTLTTPFIFDDLSNILENPHIRIPSPSLRNLAWAGFHSPEAYRPVANISFALNYYFNGYNQVGYHLVNIMIHLATGLFLYFLIKATLCTPALNNLNKHYGWIAFFTAFIWLIHPLQTQSVTYLVQRMNSMAAMFYVLSMLLYVKFRLATGVRKKWLLFCGCAAAGLLALGTKQIAATLPVFIILYEWYFFQNLNRQWARRQAPMLAGLLLIACIIALVYLNYHPLNRILADYKHRDFTLLQRVLTEFRVVVFYISLLLWPHPSRLNLDHDFALSHSLINPVTTLLSLAIIIALIATALVTAKRSPLVSFSILWFFGNLVIESSVIGLELVFEHRNYLPSMFVILAGVYLVFRYAKPVWLAPLLLCAVAALLSLWTLERNAVWSDEVSLYRDCIKKSPAKARPHNNLGATLARRDFLTEAIGHYRQALKIKPDYVDAHYNLGYALARKDKLEEAISEFTAALRLDPRNLKAHNNMGVVLMLQHRPRKAIEHFNAALKINPMDADVHNNLGAALKSLGDLDEAIKHFSMALKIDPDQPEAHNNLGAALMQQGRLDEARRHFLKALQINPDYKEARRNLKALRAGSEKK